MRVVPGENRKWCASDSRGSEPDEARFKQVCLHHVDAVTSQPGRKARDGEKVICLAPASHCKGGETAVANIVLQRPRRAQAGNRELKTIATCVIRDRAQIRTGP